MQHPIPEKNTPLPPVEWRTETAPVPYPEAVAAMEARADAIARGEAPELVWLLEHPPVYTAGTSAKAQDLLNPGAIPVYETGRGGQFTYHGPGQRVAYVLLDLKRRAGDGVPDVRVFVQTLESWLIAALARFDVTGAIREGRVGVWVDTPTGEAKIAALGIRIRKGVSYHGVALNVDLDLAPYAGIVPCGLSHFGVTSLKAMGVPATLAEVDTALRETWPFKP